MTLEDVRLRLSRPIVTHSRTYLPNTVEIEAVFVALCGHEPLTAEEALAGFPARRRLFIERSLLWLAKYGIVRIHPASF